MHLLDTSQPTEQRSTTVITVLEHVGDAVAAVDVDSLEDLAKIDPSNHNAPQKSWSSNGACKCT